MCKGPTHAVGDGFPLMLSALRYVLQGIGLTEVNGIRDTYAAWYYTSSLLSSTIKSEASPSMSLSTPLVTIDVTQSREDRYGVGEGFAPMVATVRPRQGEVQEMIRRCV